MYKSEWRGSVSSVEGMGIFTVNKRTFNLNLNSFQDFQMVEKMLYLSFNQGKNFAAKDFTDRINLVVDQMNRTYQISSV